jgi:hypothetical protein
MCRLSKSIAVASSRLPLVLLWSNKRNVRGWTERHTGVDHDGRLISRLACSQFEQVFDPGHADRWTRRVLAWIAGPAAPEDGAELAESALLAAAETGLRFEDLTVDQRRHWLTAAEDASLDPSDRMVRILVRSIGFGPAVPGSGPEPDAETVAAVARAYAVNDRAAAHGLTVDGLDQGSARQFLGRLWGLGDASEEVRTAAAPRPGLPEFRWGRGRLPPIHPRRDGRGTVAVPRRRARLTVSPFPSGQS